MARVIVDSTFVQRPDDIILGRGDQLNPFSVVALQQTVDQIASRMNGGIGLGNGSRSSQAGNLDAVNSQALTPGSPNTEFTVKHELGRIPVGMLIALVDKPGIVYASRVKSWTSTQVYLKCSAASANITVMLY